MACSGINIIYNLLLSLKSFRHFNLFSSELTKDQILLNFNRMSTAVMGDFDAYFVKHPRASDLMSFSYIMVLCSHQDEYFDKQATDPKIAELMYHL